MVKKGNKVNVNFSTCKQFFIVNDMRIGKEAVELFQSKIGEVAANFAKKACEFATENKRKTVQESDVKSAFAIQVIEDSEESEESEEE